MGCHCRLALALAMSNSITNHIRLCRNHFATIKVSLRSAYHIQDFAYEHIDYIYIYLGVRWLRSIRLF